MYTMKFPFRLNMCERTCTYYLSLLFSFSLVRSSMKYMVYMENH